MARPTPNAVLSFRVGKAKVHVHYNDPSGAYKDTVTTPTWAPKVIR